MRNTPAIPAKWQLRDHLMTELYAPVKEAEEREIRELIEKNVTLLQAQDIALHKKILQEHFHRSFAYNGKFFSVEDDTGPPIRNKLHPKLEEEMRLHTEYYVRVEEEKLRVKGFFDSMLAFGAAPADCLRILPESLRESFSSILTPESLAMPETRTDAEIEAFMAKHRPRFDLIRQRLAINLIL